MSNQTHDDAAQVSQFLHALEHPLKAEIVRLHAIILQADDQITEHIKWKAPSFCYDGDDRITFKLYPADRVQLIFHRGAKVRADGNEFKFEDESGLLKWVAKDRAIATFRSMEQVNGSEAALTQLVQRWMQSTRG